MRVATLQAVKCVRSWVSPLRFIDPGYAAGFLQRLPYCAGRPIPRPNSR
jgi:hypothetical protein